MIPEHKTRIVSPGIVACRCGWKFYSLRKERSMLKEEAKQHMEDVKKLQVTFCNGSKITAATKTSLIGMSLTVAKIDRFKKTGMGKKSFPTVEGGMRLGVCARPEAHGTREIRGRKKGPFSADKTAKEEKCKC